ncbi:MAG: DUF445 domain-containing protein [Candidatus Rokubacteria bacterium]|nr:DUF445 domain-containing protein [Candidatus Rokubacteria bacterium]
MTAVAGVPRHSKRRLALGVLLGAAALAIAAFPVRTTWWGGWVLAIAEAGIIGGLADWFAVTAIFRRPLGLPIPHTALIPANWELMARRVGTMVGDRVLTKAYVTSEIGRVDLADLIARAAGTVRRRDLEALTATIVRWAMSEVPSGAGTEVGTRLRVVLRDWRVAPLLASALELAREHGWDQRAMAALARVVDDALDRPAFRNAVEDLVDDVLDRYREHMHGYPRMLMGLASVFGLIDRARIVAAIHAGVREVAHDPEHPVRARLAEMVAELPKRLRGEPELAARVEALKVELLESDAIRRLIEDAVAEVRTVVSADIAAPRSQIVAWIADRLERARHALLLDAEMRRDIDRWVKEHVVGWVERYHARIALFIENGVRALGPEGAVRLIEEHAGDDLQYIRVNGTVVGGLAGGALYGLHLLLRLL